MRRFNTILTVTVAAGLSSLEAVLPVAWGQQNAESSAEIVNAAQTNRHSGKKLPDENPNRELLERIQQKLQRVRQLMQNRRPAAPPEAQPPRQSRQPADQAAAPQQQPEPKAAPKSQTQQPATHTPPTPAPSPALPAPQRPDTRPRPLRRTPAQSNQATPVESVPLLEQPVDLIKAARSMLRNGRYRDALRLYRSIPREAVKGNEWHWLQYEQALCWKRLGDLDAAARIYREVAAAAADPELRDACRWQLESLQWRRQVQENVRQLVPTQQAGSPQEPTP